MVTRSMRVYWVITGLLASGLGACAGYYVVFLKDHGLDDAQLLMPNMCFWLVNVIADVPTGVVADRYGRKLSVVTSCWAMAIGMGIYASSHTLAWFMVADGVIAFGRTFQTGAFEAWFNTTYRKECLDPALYSRGLHHAYSWGAIIGRSSGMLAAIVGAASAYLGVGVPFVVCAGMFILSALIAMCCMDPDRVIPRRSSAGYLQAVRFYRHDDSARMFTVFGLLMMMGMQAPNMYWAVVLRAHLHPYWFGFATSAFSLCMIAGLRISVRRSDTWPCRHWLLMSGVLTLLLLGMAGIVQNMWSIGVLFLLHEIGRGLYMARRKSCLSGRIPREQDGLQATILSLDSNAENLGAVIGLCACSQIVRVVSPQHSWTVMALMTFVLLGVLCRPSTRPAEHPQRAAP